MSVFFSSRVIAADASVKEATGLLLGATVQPFEEVANAARVEVTPTQQPMRCRTCHAYVNPWCKFTCDRARVAKSWTCGVCNAENAELSPRYADVAQETGALVELKATRAGGRAGVFLTHNTTPTLSLSLAGRRDRLRGCVTSIAATASIRVRGGHGGRRRRPVFGDGQTVPHRGA